MRWVVFGDWRYAHHEQGIAKALENRGISIYPFKYREFVSQGVSGKIQNKLLLGPAISRLNRTFREYCAKIGPDVVFMRKPIAVWGSSINLLKRQANRPTIATYNNDNPFEDGRRWTLWRNYYKVAAKADINYFFRPKDLELASLRGWAEPRLLMPYYYPALVELGQRAPKRVIGAGFYGHFEPDGRDRCVKAVLDAGLPIKVIGPRWGELEVDSKVRRYAECRWLDQEEYSRIISGTDVCICFLSKKNSDVYTRRVFEVTAAGSVLLSERTKDLQRLFREDWEAVYFGNEEELVRKLRWLLDNPRIAREIGQRGQQRCLSDGHDVQSRVDTIIREVSGVHLA